MKYLCHLNIKIAPEQTTKYFSVLCCIFFLLLCVCVCIICTSFCRCVHKCTSDCVEAGDKQWVFSLLSTLYFFETQSLTELEADRFSYTCWTLSSRDPLFHNWNYKCVRPPAFLLGASDLISGPHASRAGTLWLSPLPSLEVAFFSQRLYCIFEWRNHKSVCIKDKYKWQQAI